MWRVMRAVGVCLGCPLQMKGSVISPMQVWVCGHSQDSCAGTLSATVPPLDMLSWLVAMNHGVPCQEHHKPTPAPFRVPIL